MNQLKKWAKALKADVLALWFCQKHPETPLGAKIMAILIVAYALSPIDLIPDFIPIIGYLDDLIIIPIGVFLTLKMLPAIVLNESRSKADEWLQQHKKPVNKYAGFIILMIWIFIAYKIYTFLMLKFS